MKNKKAEMTPIGFLISFLIIIVLGIVVINYTADTAESIDVVVTTGSSSQEILTESTATLSEGDEITSSEVKANNQTWLEFDGVDDEVDLPYKNLTEATYTMWVKRKGSGNQDAFSFMDSLLRLTDTNILYFPSGSGGPKTLGYTPDANSWKFIAISQVGTKCYIYEDNNSDTSYSDCNVLHTIDVSNRIGSYTVASFNGSIDDVRIFNNSLASEPILDIYYKQRSGSLLGKGVPIMGYHHVGDISTTYYTKIADFQAQMQWLNDSGFETITFKHFVNYTLGLYDLPENPIILSFDDGALDVYTNATPIMDLYGYVGVFNLITNNVGNANSANWTQVIEMKDKGWEIASHSQTHCNFITVCNTTQNWTDEFNNSKNAIDGNISGYNTTSMIYPFTSFNSSSNDVAKNYYTFTGGYDNYIRYSEYLNYGYKNTNLFGAFERLAMDNTTTLEQYQIAINQTIPLIIQTNLNENNGTTAHDTSGNSNDGTITGVTWATDGILNTLTETVDYTINTATGLFTIVNDDYSWAWMNASWDYNDINNRNLPANTILHLIEVFIAILFIGIAWMYIRSKL